MIEGGCQCGAVRYRLNQSTVAVYACHCRECQRQSGSAFALSTPVMAADLTVSGETSVYERPTESGSITRCHFCPACGVRLFHASMRAPDRLTLKAGTLDDAVRLSPVAHLWVRSKQPWVVIGPEVQQFDTQPDDLPAWREGLMARP